MTEIKTTVQQYSRLTGNKFQKKDVDDESILKRQNHIDLKNMSHDDVKFIIENIHRKGKDNQYLINDSTLNAVKFKIVQDIGLQTDPKNIIFSSIKRKDAQDLNSAFDSDGSITIVNNLEGSAIKLKLTAGKFLKQKLMPNSQEGAISQINRLIKNNPNLKLVGRNYFNDTGTFCIVYDNKKEYKAYFGKPGKNLDYVGTPNVYRGSGQEHNGEGVVFSELYNLASKGKRHHLNGLPFLEINDSQIKDESN